MLTNKEVLNYVKLRLKEKNIDGIFIHVVDKTLRLITENSGVVLASKYVKSYEEVDAFLLIAHDENTIKRKFLFEKMLYQLKLDSFTEDVSDYMKTIRQNNEILVATYETYVKNAYYNELK